MNLKKTIGLIALALVVALIPLAACEKEVEDPVVSEASNPWSVFRFIRAQQVNVDGFVKVAVPTAVGTATPVVVIDSAGALSNPLEVRKNATPVFYLDVDGNVVLSGSSTSGGALIVDADPATATPNIYVRRQSVGDLAAFVGGTTTPTPVVYVRQAEIEIEVPLDQNDYVNITAPTAVATMQPALVVDSAGGQHNPFEVRYNATPVVAAGMTGNITVSGLVTSAGVSASNAGYFAVPTAVGTATPALFVNSAGGVGNLFELRQAATPVVQVSSSGASTWSSTFSAEHLTSTDDATIGDDLEVQGDLLANTGTITGTLGVSGLFTSVSTVRKVIAKTGVDVALTAAECYGTVVSDLGDTGSITFTLPAAVAGMDILLYNKTGNDWIVDCDDADQIFDLTDATGNKITNTTAFDYVHLIALDTTGWYTLDVHGTWTDAD